MQEIERSSASELDGLPDPDRQETQEIIDEIGQEEEKQQSEKQPEPEPKPEKKEGEETEEGKSEEEKTEQQSRKEPGLMPKWVHERAKDEYEKTISDLRKALDDSSKDTGPSSTDTPPTPEQQSDLKQKVEKMAETLAKKHQGISKELIQDLAQSLVDLNIKPAEIPQEIQEKLKAVDEFKAAQEVLAEEQAFNAAFDKEVIPLIKAEYGDLPEDTISEIRKAMMEKAYSDEYGKTPYTVIYKGLDDFRGFKRTPAASGEQGRGGFERSGDENGNADTQAEFFDNATDEDIEKMDPETFEKYTRHMEQKETGGRVRGE